MKWLVLSVCWLVSVNEVWAQCDADVLSKCAQDNSKSIFLYDFSVKMKSSKKIREQAKFEVVMNKKTKYRFRLCNPDGFETGAFLEVYGSNGKVIGSTYLEGEPPQDFEISCSKTGTYYVYITFTQPYLLKKGCVIGAMFFVEKTK